MSKNIVLIGFMGCGKSMVAQALGQRLKRQRISTDRIVEQQEGQSIPWIFENKGEDHFRVVEKRAVRQASSQQEVIIDCGGGIVLDPENLKSLKKNGIVFYLQASLEVIFERIKNEGHRPLLKGPDPLGTLRPIYQQRLPLYNQAADFIIDANDASIAGPVGEIIKKIL